MVLLVQKTDSVTYPLYAFTFYYYVRVLGVPQEQITWALIKYNKGITCRYNGPRYRLLTLPAYCRKYRR